MYTSDYLLGPMTVKGFCQEESRDIASKTARSRSRFHKVDAIVQEFLYPTVIR